MPIPIEEVLEKGSEPVFGNTVKKFDKERLVQMLRENAYSLAEIAEIFGVKKTTVRHYLYKMKKEEGVPIESRQVDGVTYYFIRE